MFCPLRGNTKEERERMIDKLDDVFVLLSNVNKYFYRDFLLLIKD